jgi:hypothetical protein
MVLGAPRRPARGRLALHPRVGGDAGLTAAAAERKGNWPGLSGHVELDAGVFSSHQSDRGGREPGGGRRGGRGEAAGFE